MIKKLIITLFTVGIFLIAPKVHAAIAFVSSTQSTVAGSVSSMTISSFNLTGNYLSVVFNADNGDGNYVTGITWNGTENLTFVGSVSRGDGSEAPILLYKLNNPTNGSYDLVVSFTGSHSANTTWLSTYSGVSASSPVAYATTTIPSGSPITINSTSTNSGSWLVGAARGYSGVITFGAGTGTIQRGTTVAQTGYIDSNGTVGTGTVGIQATFSGAGSNAAGIAAVLEPTAVATTPPQMQVIWFE